MSEQGIQNDILIALGARPDLRLWRVNAGTFRPIKGEGVIKGAPAGHPDLAGILRGGGWFGLEVKKPGEKQTEAQAKFEVMVRRFGGHYAVVRSVAEAEAVVAGWLAAAPGATA